MGNRLTRITTRTGDDGNTGLATGARLPKDSAHSFPTRRSSDHRKSVV